jgi:hypothetical protein
MTAAQPASPALVPPCAGNSPGGVSGPLPGALSEFLDTLGIAAPDMRLDSTGHPNF